MGSLLAMLLIAPKLQELRKGLGESFSKKGLLWAVVEAAEWFLAGLLGLLLVVAFVAFFYLYCLPRFFLK